MRSAIFSGVMVLLAATIAFPEALRGKEKPMGAKEAVKAFVYPDAKPFDEGREGPRIYHAKYTTPDKPEKVVEWYRGKAGLVGGEEIGFARKQEDGEASSVLDDSRKPGKTERHRGVAHDHERRHSDEEDKELRAERSRQPAKDRGRDPLRHHLPGAQ